VSADGVIPPGQSHILTLITEPAGAAGRVSLGDAYHGSVVTDLATPRDAQRRPVYLAAWKFVIGP
jgi:hypothetical protein